MEEAVSLSIRQAIEALRRGQAPEAIERFSALLEGGSDVAEAHLGLAIAHHILGDYIASDQSAATVLQHQPGNIRALLLRGQAHRHKGSHTLAVSYFQRALSFADALTSPPGDLVADLHRARAICDEARTAYEDHLESALASLDRSDRFRHALDVMLERSDPYLPRPTQFFFPGLDTRYFFDSSGFDWVPDLEAATDAIRLELIALTEVVDFLPYVEVPGDRAYTDPHRMIANRDWSAIHLIRDGKIVEENAARCPATMAALRAVPLSSIPGRTPSVLFSRLLPGARIPPHHGMLNTRLIGHLPLIVPGPAALRVGPTTHFWQEGKVCLFDDSIEHEAWNEAREARVILLFDITRPDMTQAETAAVSALFAAIDAYSGA
jgi:aspartate beta-hydroxylase